MGHSLDNATQIGPLVTSYDAWATASAIGWTYDSLLPFFKRSEQAVGGDPAHRGLNGPLHVAPGPTNDPLWDACFEAAEEAGHQSNPDGNAASPEGVSWHEVNVVGGRRQTAADAYLTSEDPAQGSWQTPTFSAYSWGTPRVSVSNTPSADRSAPRMPIARWC